MIKKKILSVAVLGLIPFAQAGAADLGIPGEISTTFGFVSEYSFRGIAQSDEEMALQGSIDYSLDNGFYAGIWGSNVDFNDTDEAQLETDIYAGFSSDFMGFSYDIGAIYYAYPGTDDETVNGDEVDYDFVELAFALGYDFDVFSVSGALNYSPDYFGGSGEALYSAAYLDVPVMEDLTLSAHIGHQDIDDEVTFGVPDYTDWSVGLGYNLSGFDLALTYIDTDLEESECADGCDERAIFSVSRTFP